MRTCQIIREIRVGETLSIRLYIPGFAVDDACLVEALAQTISETLDGDNPCRIASAIMSQLINLAAVEVTHAEGYGCRIDDRNSHESAVDCSDDFCEG